MAVRTTVVVTEVYTDPQPNVRTTSAVAEVYVVPDPNVLTTSAVVEVYIAGSAAGVPLTEALAGQATGTGAAYNASVSTGGNVTVDAGLASGTGAASDASSHVKPNAGIAAGTGSANNATVTTIPYRSASAEVATGTGSASNASAKVSVNAEATTGTGTAYDATVSLALSVTAGLATGTGDAFAAHGHVAPNTEIASGTGAAYDATVSTVISASANAELASGSGAAANASVLVAVNAGLAAGTGQAYDATATAENEVAAESASGTGAAYPASVTIAPRAGLGTGTGTALSAVVDTSVEISDSFGLDAEISLPPGTHDRRELHFGTQLDTTITTTEALGPLPAGTTLDVVLAYLYGNVPNADLPYFGLDAVIYKAAAATFGLDAYIGTPNEDTFGLTAILKRNQLFNDEFGLDAFILAAPEAWNLVQSPMGGGNATYTAISERTVPPYANPGAYANDAANGIQYHDFFGDAWQTVAAGAIGDWWQVTWSIPQTVNRVVIYDGSRQSDGTPFTAGRFGNTGNVTFSDGSSVPYSGLNDTFLVLDFAPRNVTWFRVTSTTAGGSSCSLSEVEAYNTDQWED